MTVLLEYPTWLGLLIVISIFVVSGLLIVTQVKKRIDHKITKQHEKVGRILFRVTAGLIALLISLSYANERMKQYKIVDSMETEASILVNIAIKLKILNSKESELIKQEMIFYVESTIEEQWENVEANPFFSETSKHIVKATKLAYSLPDNDEFKYQIKHDIIGELNEVSKLMQVRIYSQNTMTPYLIYILCIGLIFVWVFYTVYNLDVISLSFLSMYNIFIAILIYFIFMLSNPLVGPLKIEPDSFIILKTKGIDMVDR